MFVSRYLKYFIFQPTKIDYLDSTRENPKPNIHLHSRIFCYDQLKLVLILYDKSMVCPCFPVTIAIEKHLDD